MITQVKIYNVGSRKYAEVMVAKLKKVTDGNYHNFEYRICPAYGSLDIVLESDYEFDGEDPQKQLLDFFNMMLVSAYCKAIPEGYEP